LDLARQDGGDHHDDQYAELRMQIGLIGCGNMARALARGWGRPLLCADPVAERARSLAAEVGGEALAHNAEVAARADLVVLCHKPGQLAAVAGEIAPQAKAVVSILAATPLEAVRNVYPGKPVYRFIPSLPVEVRQGAVVQAAATVAGSDGQDAQLDAAVSELFAELGTLVVLDDALLDVAMGLMSCGPAYVALVAEAQVDAGVRRGIPAAEGASLVVQTLAGTAELLRRRDNDTVAIRREVASPGGLTARGLDALERGGLRAAFSDAMDAVLENDGA
jgi:pyrroline-5-carboxylate reductase